MSKCNHKWHFVEKNKVPKEVVHPKGFLANVIFLCAPFIIYDYYHVFVCDKCGKTKEVKEK